MMLMYIKEGLQTLFDPFDVLTGEAGEAPAL